MDAASPRRSARGVATAGGVSDRSSITVDAAMEAEMIRIPADLSSARERKIYHRAFADGRREYISRLAHSTSPAKAASSRANGALGGRPKKRLVRDRNGQAWDVSTPDPEPID